MPKSQTMTYLVTGAAGFIGARFVESCQARKISVISVDQEKYFHTRPENQNVAFGQIIDLEKLLVSLHKSRPNIDAIIHLGAVTDTRETDLELLRRLYLEYTKSLWTFATTEKLPFIYASSAATYG